jgi:peroxiredoxin
MATPEPLGAGVVAPTFVLETRPGQTVALADLLGRPVIVAFYPGDWELVSTDQLQQYQEALAEFRALGATLLAISVDSPWSHVAFASGCGLEFPLLADFEPKGAVALRYRTYNRRLGRSERALFIVDGAGLIRWSYVAPPSVNPGVDGILTALETLAEGQQPTPARPSLPVRAERP